MDLGEIKKAANFLVLVKLKVMDDNVCKLHIGPRAQAFAHSIFFMNCYGFLLLTNRFVLKYFFVKHKRSSSNKFFSELLWSFAVEQ